MNYRVAFCVLCLFAATAYAQQGVFTPGGSVDTSNLATKSDVANIQASVPQQCPSGPAADTLQGSLGTATPCVHPADATRPSSTQAQTVSTDSNGNWSVAWAKPFATSTYFVNPQAMPSSAPTQPYICNAMSGSSQTSTSVSGKCWQTTVMTLPSVLTSLLSLVLNPTAGSGAVTVRVVARDLTQ